jgi:outer membrane murein-binding lipoprotein Lpp
MSKAPNQVTLFNNGIGHFRRTYSVGSKEPTVIKIPFRKEYIGDVLASLAVFGKVRLVSPPSFTPANANATQLAIDASNALRGMLKSLSGAQVKLKLPRDSSRTGVLLGLETVPVYTPNGNITNDFVVFGDETGISRLLLTDVLNVDFTEDSVKAEIKKALSANFAKIKPESTFLEVALLSKDEKETDAVLQYTQPVAAWKMTYGIRQDKKAFAFEGAAVIDNNTDEDWNDFTVSVVTGNPISFSTDLANIVIPKRGHVSIVDSQVLGNVALEESQLEAVYGTAELASAKSLRARGGVARSAALACAGPMGGGSYSVSNRAGFGMAEVQDEACYAEAGMAQAEVSNVEAKEVGDFCVFTSGETVSLGSKRSAVVPMFNVPLATAGSVLLYKQSSHARRPFRAVKFKNETAYSLSKGKTVIYLDGVFQGECVLDAAKPGDQRTLPHCLENGVRISLEHKPSETRVTSVGFSNGTVVQQTINTRTCVYECENKKDEPFKVVIDHVNGLSDPTYTFKGIELAEREKTASGQRLYFNLPAKPKEGDKDSPKVHSLTVVETQVVSTTNYFVGNLNYVISLANGRDSILNDPLYKECLELQKKIGKAQDGVDKLESQVEKLENQSERTRKNIASAKEGQGSTYEKWVSDLDKADTEIRNLQDDLIPAAEKERDSLTETLNEKMTALSASWTECGTACKTECKKD